MPDRKLPRVLCVDDEEKLLKSIERALRNRCELHTATDGRAGLRVLASEGPFQVVVSDMKMPGMNGAEFLREVRKRSPDTVRMLLTGFADLEAVASAVNEGNIYRFISKPCTGTVLWRSIADAHQQHELITAEKELLEKTLKGCIKALTEVLSLAAPAAFGRATRIAGLALRLADELDYQRTWQVEVAAMLSQVACVTLPHETALRLYRGEELGAEESAMVERLPAITEQILAGIPRLEDVTRILAQRDLDFEPESHGDGVPEGPDIAPGARILRVANDVEQLLAGGETTDRCVGILRANRRRYDPAVVDAFERLSTDTSLDARTRGVTVEELRTGMVLVEDIVLTNGAMLVPKGQEIKVGLLERIRNFGRSSRVATPIWVRVDEESEASAEPAAAPDPAPVA